MVLKSQPLGRQKRRRGGRYSKKHPRGKREEEPGNGGASVPVQEMPAPRCTYQFTSVASSLTRLYASLHASLSILVAMGTFGERAGGRGAARRWGPPPLLQPHRTAQRRAEQSRAEPSRAEAAAAPGPPPPRRRCQWLALSRPSPAPPGARGVMQEPGGDAGLGGRRAGGLGPAAVMRGAAAGVSAARGDRVAPAGGRRRRRRRKEGGAPREMEQRRGPEAGRAHGR